MAFLTATALVTAFLAAAMLLTGTINTIATKFQDISIKGGFNHPFTQTAAMFLGEFLCLLAFAVLQTGPIRRKVEGPTSKRAELKFNPVWLLLPACCDLGGSTLMNYGLIYTTASVYQMLRGTVVIFNGILAVIFLKQRLYWHHWGGMLLIFIGTGMVGLSSVLFPTGDEHATNPLLGDALVIIAQVIAATQFVIEEKLLSKFDIPPLQCVGWEGLWGFSAVSLVLVVLYFIPGSDDGSYESAIAAFMQMGGNWKLMLSMLGSVLSIAFFNFFGISITKRISSTTRSTIDGCRTLFIWICSLALGWEVFQWLQVAGFIVLVCGTFIYNEVIRIPRYHAYYLLQKAAHENMAPTVEADRERLSLIKANKSETMAPWAAEGNVQGV